MSDLQASLVPRKQLINSRIDIPWADQVHGVLNYDGNNGVLIVYLEGRDIKTIAGESLDDVRTAVAALTQQRSSRPDIIVPEYPEEFR
jgi:hypothetical protein